MQNKLNSSYNILRIVSFHIKFSIRQFGKNASTRIIIDRATAFIRWIEFSTYSRRILDPKARTSELNELNTHTGNFSIWTREHKLKEKELTVCKTMKNTRANTYMRVCIV